MNNQINCPNCGRRNEPTSDIGPFNPPLYLNCFFCKKRYLVTTHITYSFAEQILKPSKNDNENLFDDEGLFDCEDSFD